MSNLNRKKRKKKKKKKANLCLRPVKLLLAGHAEAQEHGVPGHIGEQLELVQRNVARRVPELELDVLPVDQRRLCEEFVLRGDMRLCWILSEICLVYMNICGYCLTIMATLTRMYDAN